MVISTVIGNDSLTLEYAKKHLNITFNDDDDYIDSLILASLNAVENYCRSIFLERENVENIGKFTAGILPPHLMSGITQPPNDERVEINYVSGGVDETLEVPIRNLYTLEVNNYIYSQNHIIVNLLDTLNVDDTEDVTLKWKTGNIDTIDDAIQQARLLLIGTYYENRESVKSGISVSELPNGVVYLLESYLVPQIG